jgi:hypothetical protein
MTLPDLETSMRLAGENLINCLDRDNNYIPFWELSVKDDYSAEMRRFWPAHNLGRWWDAMLRLEQATGFEIPGEVEAAMLENLQRFFDNEYALCLCPPEIEWGDPHVELHSMREGLLALNALVRWRNSRWARMKGHRMMESINNLSNPDGTWDMNKVAVFNKGRVGTEYIDTTGSNGRLIEALVWFYQATGDALALELADRFARHHFERSTQEDGGLNVASATHHTHSYFGTLRGLLLFGELTRQNRYMERVRRTYEVTARVMVKRSGYTSHDIGEERRGETSSGGDAAQIAVWLARLGHTQYLDDAERIMRVRILPSQLRESPPLKPNGTGDDKYHDLDRRIIGGFGGMHRSPHGGKLNVTDVTAACLHTTIDVYNHVVERTAAGTSVNFHFDYADDGITVTSRRGERGELTVSPHKPANIFVRIPGFVRDFRIAVAGRPSEARRIGNFAFIPDVPTAGVTINYDLPRETFVETTNGIDYHFEMHGDDVTGIFPHDDVYPFYAALKPPSAPSSARMMTRHSRRR